jgi:hypothetical protein
MWLWQVREVRAKRDTKLFLGLRLVSDLDEMQRYKFKHFFILIVFFGKMLIIKHLWKKIS